MRIHYTIVALQAYRSLAPATSERFDKYAILLGGFWLISERNTHFAGGGGGVDNRTLALVYFLH